LKWTGQLGAKTMHRRRWT